MMMMMMMMMMIMIMVIMVAVVFSSLARIWGNVKTLIFPPVHFFFF